MTRARIRKIAIAGAATLMFGPLGLTLPAAAAGPSGYNVKGNGGLTRVATCDSYLICIYYDGSSSAYFALVQGAAGGHGISDLTGYTFNRGGSSAPGYGHTAINNANAMACSSFAYECKAYYDQFYGGNWDYLTDGGTAGFLHYVWNNEASIHVMQSPLSGGY